MRKGRSIVYHYEAKTAEEDAPEATDPDDDPVVVILLAIDGGE